MLRAFLIALAVLAAPAAAQDFPVRIHHAFGTATIPKQPARVVSLSFIGHDFLLALGVKPHALRKWYGDHPHGVWPWAQKALGNAAPIVMQGEIDIEAIAVMKPDLIVGQWSGMTENDYRLLSQIAPTIAHRAEWGPYGAPWQEMLRTLGAATGHLERAEAEIARLESPLRTDPGGPSGLAGRQRCDGLGRQHRCLYLPRHPWSPAAGLGLDRPGCH